MAQGVAIWHRDYNSGRQEAIAQDKKLLVVFTGTDWIEICGKFHDEILSQPAFIDAVSKRYALVKLEFPKNNLLPREEAMQKAILRDVYRVRGFPTVVLTDAEGRPFGLNGYQPVEPLEYANQLLVIEANHELSLEKRASAESLEGVEKAARIAEGLPDLPGGLLVRFYQAEMVAVLAGDPEDTLRLAEKFRPLLAEADYGREIQTLARDSKWVEMAAATDRHIEAQGLTGSALQGALLNRAGFERQAGLKETSLETLRKILKLDPDSEPGREAKRLLDGGAPAVVPQTEARE